MYWFSSIWGKGFKNNIKFYLIYTIYYIQVYKTQKYKIMIIF